MQLKLWTSATSLSSAPYLTCTASMSILIAMLVNLNWIIKYGLAHCISVAQSLSARQPVHLQIANGFVLGHQQVNHTQGD